MNSSIFIKCQRSSFILELSYDRWKTERMKFLLTIFTIVFTIMFSSSSFAEWTRLGKNIDGNTIYVDFEGVRKHGGFVYWWDLIDYLKPTKSGKLSDKTYNEGDCELFRFQRLSFVFHDQPMGRDTGNSFSPKKTEWEYPSPGTVNEKILKQVCSL